MGRLDKKVAIITGAASGIGEAHALLFAAEGAKVVVTDIQDDLGAAVVARINEAGNDAIYIHHDVSNPDDWAFVIDKAIEQYGGITTLINNAGIGSPYGVEDEQIDNFNRVVAVCQTGVWLGMKAAMPALKKSGNGAIVNISSAYGIIGSPGRIAYHAAKGAVRIMSKSAALEYSQQGVRVNSIHPGIISTPLVEQFPEKMTEYLRNTTPMKKLGKAMDIANGSLYLCSDEAAYVTGIELIIDGGLTAG